MYFTVFLLYDISPIVDLCLQVFAKCFVKLRLRLRHKKSLHTCRNIICHSHIGVYNHCVYNISSKLD